MDGREKMGAIHRLGAHAAVSNDVTHLFRREYDTKREVGTDRQGNGSNSNCRARCVPGRGS